VLQTLYTSLIDRTLIVLWRAVVFAAPAGAAIWLVEQRPGGRGEHRRTSGAVDDPLGVLIGLNGVILLAYVVAIPANEIVIPTVLMLTVLTGGVPEVGAGAGVMFELDAAADRRTAAREWMDHAHGGLPHALQPAAQPLLHHHLHDLQGDRQREVDGGVHAAAAGHGVRDLLPRGAAVAAGHGDGRVMAPSRKPLPADLTAPAEDYLKAIYELERGGAAAGTSDIATRLAIAPASVSGMVRRLADQGLVSHEPYRGVRLTRAGRATALRMLRRHRILECYLSEVLGYPWDRVHAEAERLEHAASDELVERMAAALGHPTVDPHGAPIPTADGVVDEQRLPALADLAVGVPARVVRVGDEDGSFLRYLDELGIAPGVAVVIRGRAPFDGPLTVGVGAAEVVMGTSAAARVFIEETSVPRPRRA
jgi:DtxR family transcriptional regulator, Mn-dependent transcriptional regulator